MSSGKIMLFLDEPVVETNFPVNFKHITFMIGEVGIFKLQKKINKTDLISVYYY